MSQVVRFKRAAHGSKDKKFYHMTNALAKMNFIITVSSGATTDRFDFW